MSDTEDTWAQLVFKEIGETYPILATAFDELYTALREQEDAEITAAALQMDEQDRLEAEYAAKIARIETMMLDNVERISELEADLSELKGNPLEHDPAPDDADASILSVLAEQLKSYQTNKEELYAGLRHFGSQEEEKNAFEVAYETVGLLLEKAHFEHDLNNFVACEGTLDEVQSKLSSMQALLQDAKEASSPPPKGTLLEDLSEDIARVIDCIAALNTIGYRGLSTRLLTALNKNQSSKSSKGSPAWEELRKETLACQAAMLELSSMTKYIKKLCESMATAGPSEAAEDTLAELDNYQSDPARSLPSVMCFISTLKAAAIRREKWIKNKEWAQTNLDIRTRNYKAQLEKIVLFDEDDQLITKKSTTLAYARADDVDGLKKDAMMDIPKRPKDKNAKAVPRATVDSLLESFDFLEEIRSSGVSGIEAIAIEEFLKTEDILDGVNRNPEGYSDFQKRIQKILDKVERTKSGKEALFYIEAKMSLEDSVRVLREKAPSMNINKAIRECREIETQTLEPLLANLKSALEYKKIFEGKIDPVEKLFKLIPILLSKLGAARPELAQKFKAIWQPEDEKIYHGELELLLRQAKVTCENSANLEDLKEAVNQINRVNVQARRYAKELKTRLEKLAEGGNSQITDTEEDFFHKVEEDYKQGIQQEKDRKVSKGNFNQKMGPMKDELEMLTAKASSWKNVKAKIKGIERIDETKFDPTQFKDLLTEVKLLEQECAVSGSYEDNMGRLDELKGMFDALRSELTGFREDIAKDIGTATEKCVARMDLARSFAEDNFVNVVASKQETNENYVNKSTLKAFANCVAKPIVSGDLTKHAQTIADKRKPIEERKKAREEALRIVRPLLARLDGDNAITLYRRHPFSDLKNDYNMLRPALVQLEVKLLTLAS
ncbi:hypothetical protein [Pseudovibrio axinellae]|nr:hypothetical protein [Pseudovibrio axinellae]